MAEYDATQEALVECKDCHGAGYLYKSDGLTGGTVICQRCGGNRQEMDHALYVKLTTAFHAGRISGLEEAAKVCVEHAEAFDIYLDPDAARFKKQVGFVEADIRALAQEGKNNG